MPFRKTKQSSRTVERPAAVGQKRKFNGRACSRRPIGRQMSEGSLYPGSRTEDRATYVKQARRPGRLRPRKRKAPIARGLRESGRAKQDRKVPARPMSVTSCRDVSGRYALFDVRRMRLELRLRDDALVVK